MSNFHIKTDVQVAFTFLPWLTLTWNVVVKNAGTWLLILNTYFINHFNLVQVFLASVCPGIHLLFSLGSTDFSFLLLSGQCKCILAVKTTPEQIQTSAAVVWVADVLLEIYKLQYACGRAQVFCAVPIMYTIQK